MQKANDLLQQTMRSMSSGPLAHKEQASVSTTSTPPSYELRIDILFTRLGAIYGQLWWNNYRTEALLLLAKQEWSEALKQFDNQILKEVLILCREKKNYPPMLPQFVESCKAAQSRRIIPLAKEPANVSSFEVAKVHLSAMKKMLNK